MKKIIAVFMLSVALCFSFSYSAYCAVSSSPDEAVLAPADSEYIPLYTKSPDSISGEIGDFESHTRESNLSYVQPAVLALIVGYLILFKKKGINNTEKLHRRKK